MLGPCHTLGAAGYGKRCKISAVGVGALCAYTVFAVHIYSPTVHQQLEESQVSFSRSPKCSIGEWCFFLVKKKKSRNKRHWKRHWTNTHTQILHSSQASFSSVCCSFKTRTWKGSSFNFFVQLKRSVSLCYLMLFQVFPVSMAAYVS